MGIKEKMENIVVDLIAQEINDHHKKASLLAEEAVTKAQAAIEEVLHAGMKLQRKKSELKNGEKFSAWLESSIDFSRTTAYRYMGAYSHYLRAKRLNCEVSYASVKELYIAAGIMPGPEPSQVEKLERHPFATLITATEWAAKKAEELLPEQRAELTTRLKPLAELYHQLIQS